MKTSNSQIMPISATVGGQRSQERLFSIVKFAFLSLLLLLYLVPFYLVLINSLKPDDAILSSPLALPKVIRLANFAEAAEKMHFFSAFKNSFLITSVSVAIIAILPAMCAWYLVRNKSKLSTTLYMVMVASMIIPFQALMIPLLQIYGSIGLLNSPASLIYMYAGFGTPLAVFIYHGTIKSIPLELEEASLIDGCNAAQTFRVVVLPLLQPTMVTIIILDVLWIWNDYLLPSLVLLTAANRTLPLSTYNFYSTYTVNYGLLLAALVMTILPVIFAYLFLQRYIIKGISAGAIK